MNAKTFQLIFYAARVLTPGVTVSARIPMAQAQLETQLGTTGVALTANNLFGMKQPVVRKTTSMGANAAGYASFSSKMQSIRDYLYFLHDMGLTDDGKLMAYIVAGKYAKDKAYLPKLEAIIKKQSTDLVHPLRFVLIALGCLAGLVCGIKVINSVLK